jgi:hypothetical protein
MAARGHAGPASGLPGGFQSATIILPVMNETISLERTVEIILRDLHDRLREILIVVCDRTTAEAMSTVASLAARSPELIVVHHQKLPFLGGAIREAGQSHFKTFAGV